MIYIGLWFILFIFTVPSKQIEGFKIAFSFILLLLIFGLRDIDVGIDTINYKGIFDGINRFNGQGYEYLEIGWFILNRITGFLFNDNYTALLMIVGCLLLAPIFYVGFKETKNIFYVLLVFHSLSFYTVSFNIMRQCLAISFVFLFFYFVFKKKKILGTVSFLFALSFHSSSIFALLYFIPFKFNTKNIHIYQILTLLVGILLYNVVSKMSYTRILYGGYLTGEEMFREDIIAAFITVVLLNVFLYLILSKLPIIERWNRVFVLSILTLNMIFFLHYGTRVYNIFSISQIIVFTNILSAKIYNRYTFKLKIMVWIYIIMIFAKTLITNANGILPYKFV